MILMTHQFVYVEWNFHEFSKSLTSIPMTFDLFQFEKQKNLPGSHLVFKLRERDV